MTQTRAESQDVDLLRLALSRPDDARLLARQALASTTDPGRRSRAHQAIGIVLRDRGELPAALTELRAALRAARRSGDPGRVCDVQATLGAALVMAGRTKAGLVELDRACAGAHGQGAATALMRRAHVLSLLGRHREALADLRAALAGIRRSGDPIWEARALNNRALVHIALGDATRAERDIKTAAGLFSAAGQELESVHAVHNRAVIAYLRGALPEALRWYDEAGSGYDRLGVTSPDLALDRAQALLAAAMPADAESLLAATLNGSSLQPAKRAELLLLRAIAVLAAGDPAAAVPLAQQAGKLFAAQRRAWWQLRAKYVAGEAAYATGRRGRGLRDSVATTAADLAARRAEEAPAALLLAARLTNSVDPATAETYWAAAARYRTRGPNVARATGWLAQAERSRAGGSSRGVYLACACGLSALDEHLASLGSAELRASATEHGRALAGLALRQAVAGGDGRTLLKWAERWRATALAGPPLGPPPDPEEATDLAVLRDCARRIDAAREQGSATAALEAERLQLEAGIRRRRFRRTGQAEPTAGLSISELVTELGDQALVELIEVDGVLHAVVIASRQVRRYVVGGAADAHRAVEYAQFALRRAARGRPSGLADLGEELQRCLLGPVAGRLGAGPVIISPPASLHATPWALLPALADLPLASVPSAAMWQRAARTSDPAGGQVVLVAGPGLQSGGAEVVALARQEPGAQLLAGPEAAVVPTLRALDGAALAHLACHGRFRRDSPMFSSLILADGPLTVHDLERLRRAPHRVVLSACDSGVQAPVGADELLGLGSALISLGTAGLVSAVATVNDSASVDCMLLVHQGLRDRLDLATALLRARQAAVGDDVAAATAASYTAIGV